MGRSRKRKLTRAAARTKMAVETAAAAGAIFVPVGSVTPLADGPMLRPFRDHVVQAVPHDLPERTFLDQVHVLRTVSYAVTGDAPENYGFQLTVPLDFG